MIKILLVEDDLSLSNSIFDFLDESYEVLQVFDGYEGLFEAKTNIYDLILLDLMLPEIDGFDVLRELRKEGIETPVLIMTAKEGISDKAHGFEIGADDYLTKPFYLEELKMRIKSLLKRSGKLEEHALKYGDLEVNLQGNVVKIDGERKNIAGKEYELLIYFLQNQGAIIPKEQIFDRLWGFDSDTTIQVVEVYVSKLRKNLKDSQFEKHLSTIRSVGYILNKMEEK
ncbi:MAG: response regulator transcription factor [Streptococcaceae bacterium]|jgi:two-component system response regulator CiaR|nr:response regulator transcription factor [Streptococcaceae bacterium]